MICIYASHGHREDCLMASIWPVEKASAPEEALLAPAPGQRFPQGQQLQNGVADGMHAGFRRAAAAPEEALLPPAKAPAVLDQPVVLALVSGAVAHNDHCVV